jgi:hypothetical protein
MKWINGETWESKKKRLGDWHKWFAWFPVVIDLKEMPDGKIRRVKAWLCYVERKGALVKVMRSQWSYSLGWEWEYREITK